MEKTVKNPFVRGHDRFEGRGRLSTKINIAFFVGIEVFNIFRSTTFLKKKHIFQNNRGKLFLGTLDDKHEYSLSFGKLGTKYSF